MKSLMYRSPKLYNFFMRLMHGKYFLYKYKEIARIIGKNKNVLDLGCGTGLLSKFLDKSCIYEGWDLNEDFLKHKNDLNVKCKNVLDFNSYPDSDVIIIADLLHHITPRHEELLVNARKKAKYVIILEPKYNLIGGGLRLGGFLYRLFDTILGDNDGINDFEDRVNWFDGRNETFNFFLNLKPKSITEIGLDYLVILEGKN